MAIKVLPENVAAQIAAGEVVERPSSVVKELMENALDAGAHTISVEMLEGGQRQIKIADDGCGIAAEEVELAFHRYATSKLATIKDLDTIGTLGFRGEALASIASVSRITLITRAPGETYGTRLQLDGGRLIGREVVGAPQGTVMVVENLFYNVPARLKFLKKESTERSHVGALISRYAMAYPHVRFSLRHGDQEVLRTTGNSTLRDALGSVYGLDTVEQMIEIGAQADEHHREDLPVISISGYVGLPSLNRSNRNQITVFVNGRWIQDSSLTYAIVQAYHTMLMTGRYPVVVLMVNLPPEDVDVNVHPTKAEVRFRRPDAVFSAVQRAVRRTLVDNAPPPNMRTEVLWGSPEMAVRRERIAQITTERINQLGLTMNMESPGQYGQHRGQPQEEVAESETPSRSRRKREIPMLRVVGQVGATYIIAEGPTGLYLIDQHAAHERVLYEQFMAERSSAPAASQELLEAIAVDLLPEHIALIQDNIAELKAAGFNVEPFGRSTVQIRAVPALVSQSDPVQALLAAIGEIECGEAPLEATAEEKLIARVCKQAAVKAGQVLSVTEMEALVRQLEACQSPRTCPHGRPTMLHLSAEDLAKEFGRLGAI
jgi:DNA mismatch repair protein MutL